MSRTGTGYGALIAVVIIDHQEIPEEDNEESCALRAAVAISRYLRDCTVVGVDLVIATKSEIDFMKLEAVRETCIFNKTTHGRITLRVEPTREK